MAKEQNLSTESFSFSQKHVSSSKITPTANYKGKVGKGVMPPLF